MQASKTAGMNFPKWFISSPGRFSTALICNLLGTQILAEKGNSTQEYLDRATTQPHSLTISSLTFIVFVAAERILSASIFSAAQASTRNYR
jgi:hypothetical protein